MAFFRGDVDMARGYQQDVERNGLAKWQLESTITDLRIDVAHHEDAETRDGLAAVLADLARIHR